MFAEDPAHAWASSGAMWLTGKPDGPPLLAPGAPAAYAREQASHLGLDLPTVLSERAAIAGLRRNAPWSCGGSFRALPTAEGHIALSLARESDVELVPALIEADAGDSPWDAVSQWASQTTTHDAAERLSMLGMPGHAVGPQESDAARGPVAITPGGQRSHRRERPVVVDLTSLWAGPLCAHLLGLLGADVIKVESTTRPDGARRGPREFYDLLHAGHRSIAVDFTNPRDVDALITVLQAADLVLEASRPRAMRNLGVPVDQLVAHGTSWLSITAGGRESNDVGFGDDVAVAAGIYAWVDGQMAPCGDALADPLTGLVAARSAADALKSPHAQLIDVSMRHVCLEALGDGTMPDANVVRRADAWWVDCAAGLVRVEPPTARKATARAADMGAHTTDVLAWAASL
jgi:hypothetical protein